MTTRKTTRRTLAGLAALTLVVLAGIGLGRSLQADEPPLTPNAQAFVDTLETFETLQTDVVITPWFEEGVRIHGVLHIRSDGVMALDGARQSRYTFDGSRFTSDRYGVSGQPTELWADRVEATNLVFDAIRGGNVTWTPNSPFDYGLHDGPGVELLDWAELQLPGAVDAGYRMFFGLRSGSTGTPGVFWAYKGNEQVGMVTFQTWIVDPPIPPQAFSPQAPPFQVELWQDPFFSTPRPR